MVDLVENVASSFCLQVSCYVEQFCLDLATGFCKFRALRICMQRFLTENIVNMKLRLST